MAYTVMGYIVMAALRRAGSHSEPEANRPQRPRAHPPVKNIVMARVLVCSVVPYVVMVWTAMPYVGMVYAAMPHAVRVINSYGTAEDLGSHVPTPR